MNMSGEKKIKLPLYKIMEGMLREPENKKDIMQLGYAIENKASEIINDMISDDKEIIQHTITKTPNDISPENPSTKNNMIILTIIGMIVVTLLISAMIYNQAVLYFLSAMMTIIFVSGTHNAAKDKKEKFIRQYRIGSFNYNIWLSNIVHKIIITNKSIYQIQLNINPTEVLGTQPNDEITYITKQIIYEDIKQIKYSKNNYDTEETTIHCLDITGKPLIELHDPSESELNTLQQNIKYINL